MKIASVTLTHHRIPLDPPVRSAWDPRPRCSFGVVIVRVQTDDGRVGIGSGDAMPGLRGNEDLFVGGDPLDLDGHFRRIESLSFHYGRCWPLEVALWDLAGKIREEPCWRMLGGRSGRVRTYASAATRRDVVETVDHARRMRDAGFPALKLRFHHEDWRRDVEALRAARKAVGDRMGLMVDCNQGWRMPWDTREPWSLDEATAVVDRLEELDVEWIEEPLHRGDYAGLRALRGRTRVRVACGEMTRELHDLRELVTRGCVDIVQPDAVLSGGMAGAARVAGLARTHGVGFTPHTWGNGIGLVANAHVAAAFAGDLPLEFPFDPPTWTPEHRDFALRRPRHTDSSGWMDLGRAPGLGLDLDEERLEETRIDA